MPTVYIETSIPSYYFETRRSPQIIAWREATRNWWKLERPQYDLITSRVAIEELERIPTAKRARCLRLMGDVRLLPDPPKLKETVATYVESLLMPRFPLADALHLAIASLHGADYLLTWNCRHLANATKARHIQVVNSRLGLRGPIMATPFTLTRETNR